MSPDASSPNATRANPQDLTQRESLGLAWTYAVKESIWAFTRHRPGSRKNIALFTTRRGGSTWLMEVIAANRGVRFIDQPFSLFRAAPGHLARLLIPDRSEFITLDAEEEVRVRQFVQGLLNGSIQVNAPWAVWARTFHFRTDRVVLKITNAKALIDWFDATFALHVVFAPRHPLPLSLSVIRNGWALTGPPFLRNAAFVEAYLTDAQLARGWDVLRNGTLLEQHVLGWVLENLVPLRLLDARPHWLVLPYESVVLNPERAVERLATVLDLPDRARMLRQAGAASRSTRKLSSTFAPGEVGRARLGRWRRQITEEEERAAMGIVDAFGIDFYRMGDDLPKNPDAYL